MTESKKFYRLTPEERRTVIAKKYTLTEEEKQLLTSSFQPITDKFSENVISSFPFPYAIARNFIINGTSLPIPMVIEESSVVAAASNGAKLTLPNGISASSDEPIMIGQIQIITDTPEEDATKILAAKNEILATANARDSILIRLGGGAKNIEIRQVGKFLVLHLLVDVRDAMGANAVNSMCEAIGPLIKSITGSGIGLKILSNFAVHRLAHATAIVPKQNFSKSGDPEEIIDNIINASEFAELDPYRAVTHNKGIMNGIDALTIACGNDWRAIEAGAHAYASRSGTYRPLSTWTKNEQGNLLGKIELPIQIGTVGGITRIHPFAALSLRLLNNPSSTQLAEILAAVGLVQNLAAIRAVSNEGIQKGHMSLHANNIAIQAGATEVEIEEVSKRMHASERINQATAEEILLKLRSKRKDSK